MALSVPHPTWFTLLVAAMLLCGPLASGLTLHEEALNCTLRDTCGLQHLLSDERHYTCSCAPGCSTYGDCCHNYPGSSERGGGVAMATCRILRPISTRTGIYVVDKCPAGYGNSDIRSRCESQILPASVTSKQGIKDSTMQYYPRTLSPDEGILPYVPVSSQSGGGLYRNIYCALCNGVEDETFWNVKIQYPKPIDASIMDNTSELQDMFGESWRRGRVTFTHPTAEVRPCRISVISECAAGAPAPEREQCAGATSRVFADGYVYKNAYCAQCNGVNETSCIDPLPLLIGFSIPPKRPLPYALLLDLNAGTASLYSNKVGFYKITSQDDSHHGDTLPFNATNCSNQVYDPIFDRCSHICDAEDQMLQVCSKGNHSAGSGGDNHWQLVFKFEVGLGYVTIVGNVLSMLGLVVLLGVYAWLSALRNTPGRCLMCLAGSLLAAQLLFTVGLDKVRPAGLCVAIALLMHYCFLAQFCWMNAMAFDVWRAFKAQTQSFRAKAKTRSRHFLYYSTYSWTCPAAIVLVSCLLDHLDSAVVRPAYGHTFCWFGSRMGLLVLFALPVGLVILVNCVFFTLTARNICQASEGSDILHPGQKEQRRRLLLYIKLAVIMGLAWIFGFLAAAFDNAVLWYIFTISNAFQGVFICVSFVFTQKVFKAVREEVHSCSRANGSRWSRDGNDVTTTRHTTSTKKSSLEIVKSLQGRHSKEASSAGRLNRSILVK